MTDKTRIVKIAPATIARCHEFADRLEAHHRQKGTHQERHDRTDSRSGNAFAKIVEVGCAMFYGVDDTIDWSVRGHDSKIDFWVWDTPVDCKRIKWFGETLWLNVDPAFPKRRPEAHPHFTELCYVAGIVLKDESSVYVHGEITASIFVRQAIPRIGPRDGKPCLTLSANSWLTPGLILPCAPEWERKGELAL